VRQGEKSIKRGHKKSPFLKDVLLDPPVFWFKRDGKYFPFPVLHYQIASKPYHLRALCKCKCCNTILCGNYVRYGAKKNIYSSPWGYHDPKKLEGYELHGFFKDDTATPDGRLHHRVFKLSQVLNLRDGRFFSYLEEIT
jgi:hypothetical protein